jgi:hypothetical protein
MVSASRNDTYLPETISIARSRLNVQVEPNMHREMHLSEYILDPYAGESVIRLVELEALEQVNITRSYTDY